MPRIDYRNFLYEERPAEPLEPGAAGSNDRDDLVRLVQIVGHVLDAQAPTTIESCYSASYCFFSILGREEGPVVEGAATPRLDRAKLATLTDCEAVSVLVESFNDPLGRRAEGSYREEYLMAIGALV